VIRVVLVRHAARGYHLLAFGALGGKQFLIARDAVVLVVLWDEALRPQSFLALITRETVLVPLFTLVFHLLRAWPEDLLASVASRREFVGVTFAAVDLFIFRTERFVDERVVADGADEAPFVPMLLFVREILGVGADNLLTFGARVGKELFVASDAIRMFFPQNVSLTSQGLVAVPTSEMLGVEFLVHGASVFARKYQLLREVL